MASNFDIDISIRWQPLSIYGQMCLLWGVAYSFLGFHWVG